MLPHKAKGRRRVSVVILNSHGGHTVDADNCLKSLLDGLKKCGQIIDDSDKHLELGKVSSILGQTNSTIITIEELSE